MYAIDIYPEMPFVFEALYGLLQVGCYFSLIMGYSTGQNWKIDFVYDNLDYLFTLGLEFHDLSVLVVVYFFSDTCSQVGRDFP